MPHLLRKYDVRSILDLPCGDYNWMQKVSFGNVDYIGADIVTEIVEANRRYCSDHTRFVVLNILEERLPKADLILVRDCLVHFSFKDAFQALRNIKQSDIRYLLCTTYPTLVRNYDIVTGQWRRLNLSKAPFAFPEPTSEILEESTESEGDYADKTLALWKIADIPVYEV